MQTTENNKKVLADIHQVQLKMMNTILSALEEHHITYYLGYGTFLGAVRHSGFIPWDDDVDIQLPYKDYRRFLKLCKKALNPNDYEIQSSEDMGNNFLFSKIRAKGTFIPTIYNSGADLEGNGIWIDFFGVIYAAGTDKWIEKQMALLRGTQKIKTKYLGYTKKNSLKNFAKRIINLGLFLLCKTTFFLARIIGEWSNHTECINIGTAYYEVHSPELCRKKGSLLPAKLFEKKKKYPFEGSSFYGVEDYDTYLCACYTKNYMIPDRSYTHVTDYSKVIIQ